MGEAIEVDTAHEKSNSTAMSHAAANVSAFVVNIATVLGHMLAPLNSDIDKSAEAFEVWREVTTMNLALFRIAETLHENVVDIEKSKSGDIAKLKEYAQNVTRLWALPADSPQRRQLVDTEQVLSQQIKQLCPHMPLERIWELFKNEFARLTSIDTMDAYSELFVNPLLQHNYCLYNRLYTDKVIFESLQIIRDCSLRLNLKKTRYMQIIEGLFASPFFMNLFSSLPEMSKLSS